MDINKCFIILLMVIAITYGSTIQDTPIEERVSVTCPIPFQNIMGYCLHFNVLGTGSWQEMRDYCNMVGGDMAKINSPDLMYDIIKFLEEALDIKHFWIGATDEGHEGDWKWTDDTKVKMGSPFWGIGCFKNSTTVQEPYGGIDQNCAMMKRACFYYFHDDVCSSTHSVICQYQSQE